MTKIRWTLKEQATLVEACCRMLKSGVAESNLQAIRKAQGILVEGRRRDIITIGMVPWLEAAVRDRQAIEAEASRKADLERNRTVTDMPVDLLLQKLIAGITPHIEQIVSKQLSAAKIQSAMDSAMATYLKELTGGMTAIGKKAALAASKSERKKIVLVNLLNSQFNEIESEFKELFDFVLWCDKDDSYTTLKTHTANAYRIFGMTDFMRHSVDKFLSVNAKERYIRFTGGVSTLKGLIEHEYCEM